MRTGLVVKRTVTSIMPKQDANSANRQRTFPRPTLLSVAEGGKLPGGINY